MTRPLPGECLCGDWLDQDGDCRRCDLGFDDCSRCDAILDETGRCWTCDSAWIWTTP